MRSLLIPTVLVALLLAASAQADNDTLTRFLNAALRLYENLEYERALEQIQNARHSAATPEEQALVNVYEGMVLADLGRTDDARGAFRAALLLNPEAQLPLKVSPKVKADFELMRGSVQRELAPLLAKQEEERRRKLDQDRLAAEQRGAEAAAKEAAARAAEQKRQQEAAAARAAAEQKPRPRDPGQPDAPVVAQLTPSNPPVAEPVLVTRAPVASGRGFPVLAALFVGAGAVSGGLGAYFGSQSQSSVTAARNEPYQQPADAQLARARDSATVANGLFVGAGVLGTAAIIAAIVWAASPSEPAALSPTSARQ